MIDRAYIGTDFPKVVLEIEKGRLRFFAKAIGETDPIYTDETAAKAAGYPSLPAPPTFIYAAELDAGRLEPAMKALGIDLTRTLHGEQHFTYHGPICAGDTIRSSRRSPTSTTGRTVRSNSSSGNPSSPTSMGSGNAQRSRRSPLRSDALTELSFANVGVGDTLPLLTLPALDRTTLALFAGASGDHFPYHIDIDAARKAGMPDVIGHGMLSMAYLGRLVTRWVPQAALRRLDVRFVRMTHLGNVMTCTGMIIGKEERDGEKLVHVEIRAIDHFGEIKTAGEAVLALP
jgi:acyl dehydratase